MEESCLEKLKKDYAKLQKKYRLPSFSELNEDFEIEKLQDRETDFLMRGIRRTIIEKIAALMRFFELILNPAEAATPLFVFAILRGIKSETKNTVEKLYKELSVYELASLNLDIQYSEKEEVKFVNDFTKKWKEMKPVLAKITHELSIVWKDEHKERKYLG